MNEPEPDEVDDPIESTSLIAHQRLWTPWRMKYVGGGKYESGCIFCNRLAANDDVHSLILHRGVHAFVIMNLFPYNTGHTMIVPTEHVGSPEDASPEAMAELSILLRPLLRALRRALGCGGFNLGMNVGAEAGAGIAEHLHEHVVPRWTGDANFMPILANTMVMPEMIPVSYVKLRAELARELSGDATAQCVVLAGQDQFVLVDAAGRLPACSAANNEPVWQAIARYVYELTGAPVQLAGWAADPIATSGQSALTYRIESSAHFSLEAASSDFRWAPVAAALDGPDQVTVSRSLENLASG